MQAFLEFLGGSKTGEKGVLSTSLLREWFLPRMLLPDGVSGFGMPWEMTQAMSTEGTVLFPF
jgi:hypothetical protein